MLRAALLTIAAASVVPWAVYAHVLVSEPERLRNDNHFTEGGFAEPQVGECGPSDLDPTGAFCPFRVEDDWSFENPVNIIDETRVPQPGLTGVPGFDVLCDLSANGPGGTNPGCPLAPAFPGGPPGFGACVPAGPAGGTCDLSAGAPRPRAGIALSSSFAGRDDVDVGIYNYDPSFGEVTMVGIAQTPACRENIEFFPTVAWAGPLGLLDARSGEPLFQRRGQVYGLPLEVLVGLPPGYGIRVTPPEPGYRPRRSDPRPGFYSGFAQSAWLYNPGTQIVPCVQDAESCIADPDSTHFDNNDVFFLRSDSPVDLYAIWWADQGRVDDDDDDDSQAGKRTVRDGAMVIGTTDKFTPGDFAALEFQGKSIGNGRDIHGLCRDPRPTGKVDITIESPEEGVFGPAP